MSSETQTQIVGVGNIIRVIGGLLEKMPEYIADDGRREFELEATAALGAFVKAVYEAADKHRNGAWPLYRRRFLELRAQVERSRRRAELLRPSDLGKFRANLWWMTQHGDETDLELLRRLKADPTYGSIEFIRLLDRAIDRIVVERDRGAELRSFFGFDEKEFAEIVTDLEWEGRLPEAFQDYTALATLALIKEKLEGLIEEREMRGWLNSAQPKSLAKTPIQAIKDGEAFRVLQLLVGLEEGLPT